MAIRRLSPKTQYQYIRHVKKFADFLGRSADKATAEDVHRYQLWLASIGASVGTANVSATALRFFFKVTLKRHDLAEELISTREPPIPKTQPCGTASAMPMVSERERVAFFFKLARLAQHFLVLLDPFPVDHLLRGDDVVDRHRAPMGLIFALYLSALR
jgi:hypothetical protein